jgi:hypothetical protein
MLQKIKDKDPGQARQEQGKSKDKLKEYFGKVKPKRNSSNVKAGNKLMKKSKHIAFEVEQAGDLAIP